MTSEKIAEEENKEATIILRRLKQQDFNRETGFVMRKIMKRQRCDQVDKAQITTSSGEIEELTAQGPAEEALKEMCEKRFRSTEDAPFMVEPLRTPTGNGDTETAKQMSQGGVMLPEDVDEGTQKFIDDMAAKLNLDTNKICTRMSTKDFIKCWKKAKEKTSSSMSGRHFGHCKAATESKLAGAIHSKFLDLSFNHGFTASRWKNGR